MPGRRERERELARRRYERRQQREMAKRARRRQLLARAGVITAIIAVLAGSGFGISTAVSGGGGKHKLAATPSPTPTSPTPTVFNGSCQYKRATSPASRNVGVPPQTGVQKRNYVATIKTNRGVITVALNGTAAPCTVNSFAYLAQKHYFNNTKCHRLTTQGIYVLQCGDPSATGGGGPGYEFADENLAAFGTGQMVTYPAATVAMANAGPGTNGSQFFLVYKPSPLAPAYTPFGRITSGLALLQQIAAKGSTPAGDGKPTETVVIESVTIRAA